MNETLKRRRLWWLIPLWLVAAFVLAFPLRDVVDEIIILPIAYLLWLLGLLYKAIPQPILWIVLVTVLLYGAFSVVLKNIDRNDGQQKKLPPLQGPVEALGRAISRESRGVYFKWQVARLLADLALEQQELRTHTASRKLFPDGQFVPPEVVRYLDAGLNTSFSDYPLPGPLRKRDATPLDIELDPVLDYLEAQMEMEHDRRRS